MLFPALLHSPFRGLDGLGILALFEQGGREVVQVCDVRVGVPCALVVGYCGIKVAGLVGCVALLLFLVGGLF